MRDDYQGLRAAKAVDRLARGRADVAGEDHAEDGPPLPVDGSHQHGEFAGSRAERPGGLPDRLLVSVGLLLATLACGPLLVIPGGRLSGELVTEPVEDWSFVGDRFVDLEVRPEAPYSVELFYVVRESAAQEIRRRAPGFGEETRTEVTTSVGELRQPRTSADGKHLVYLLERLDRIDATADTGAAMFRSQTELRQWSLGSGYDVVLYTDISDETTLIRIIGQTVDGDWLLLRNLNFSAADASAQILRVGREGTAEVVTTFPGNVGTCILHPASSVVYLTWTPAAERAQNLYSFDLSDLSHRRITPNERGGTLYSQPQVVPEGRLLYTQHEFNSDIWLIRFEF